MMFSVDRVRDNRGRKLPTDMTKQYTKQYFNGR